MSNSDELTGCALLRGLVFGDKSNSHIQARLGALSGIPEDFQGLAFDLTGLTVPEETAKAVFRSLATHLQHLREALQRPIGIRTAALDLSDRLESFLREEGDLRELSHENLVQMAFVDYLTGLPNLRSLSERFESEIKRAQRYGRLLSLIMIDVDGFKEINDRFGHLAGNAALKHVAGLLRNFVRETDVTGRYGGDEFMILLPETPKHTPWSNLKDDPFGLTEEMVRTTLAAMDDLKLYGPPFCQNSATQWGQLCLQIAALFGAKLPAWLNNPLPVVVGHTHGDPNPRNCLVHPDDPLDMQWIDCGEYRPDGRRS